MVVRRRSARGVRAVARPWAQDDFGHLAAGVRRGRISARLMPRTARVLGPPRHRSRTPRCRRWMAIDVAGGDRRARRGSTASRRRACVRQPGRPDDGHRLPASAIDGVALLACGGAVPPAPEASAALLGVFDESLSPERHLDHVRTAFFAYGNDASGVARWLAHQRRDAPDHRHATSRTGRTLVGRGQGSRARSSTRSADVIAPDRQCTRHRRSGSATAPSLVAISDAGHALLPGAARRRGRRRSIDWLRRSVVMTRCDEPGRKPLWGSRRCGVRAWGRVLHVCASSFPPVEV